MKIYLVPNLQKVQADAVTHHVISILSKHGATVFLCDDMVTFFSDTVATFVPQEQAIAQCDVVVTIGGDGTMLHMARHIVRKHKPLLGINLGRTGFLATVEMYELEGKLARLVTGDYTLDHRGMIAVSVSGENNFTEYALNDVVISKATVSNTIDVQVYCDDILAVHYQGDGIIVATPTGSTAYSLSAGGPVLDASISGTVVTPICAHGLRSPAMVFSAQRKLRVNVNSTSERTAHLSCDGIGHSVISCNDEIQVSFADMKIPLICFNKADQFEAIDKKLKGR